MTLALVGDGELRGDLRKRRCRRRARPGADHRLARRGGVRAEIAVRWLVMPSFARAADGDHGSLAMARPIIDLYRRRPEFGARGEHGWLVPAGDPAALAEPW